MSGSPKRRYREQGQAFRLLLVNHARNPGTYRDLLDDVCREITYPLDAFCDDWYPFPGAGTSGDHVPTPVPVCPTPLLDSRAEKVAGRWVAMSQADRDRLRHLFPDLGGALDLLWAADKRTD